MKFLESVIVDARPRKNRLDNRLGKTSADNTIVHSPEMHEMGGAQGVADGDNNMNEKAFTQLPEQNVSSQPKQKIDNSLSRPQKSLPGPENSLVNFLENKVNETFISGVSSDQDPVITPDISSSISSQTAVLVNTKKQSQQTNELLNKQTASDNISSDNDVLMKRDITDKNIHKTQSLADFNNSDNDRSVHSHIQFPQKKEIQKKVKSDDASQVSVKKNFLPPDIDFQNKLSQTQFNSADEDKRAQASPHKNITSQTSISDISSDQTSIITSDIPSSVSSQKTVLENTKNQLHKTNELLNKPTLSESVSEENQYSAQAGSAQKYTDSNLRSQQVSNRAVPQPQPQPEPQVHIGQIDVLVETQSLPVKPAVPMLSDRGFSSRYYVRKLM